MRPLCREQLQPGGGLPAFTGRQGTPRAFSFGMGPTGFFTPDGLATFFTPSLPAALAALATFGIGASGAMNAAIFAAQVCALTDPELATRLVEFRRKQAAAVPVTVED